MFFFIGDQHSDKPPVRFAAVCDETRDRSKNNACRTGKMAQGAPDAPPRSYTRGLWRPTGSAKALASKKLSSKLAPFWGSVFV